MTSDTFFPSGVSKIELPPAVGGQGGVDITGSNSDAINVVCTLGTYDFPSILFLSL